jgi:hypothetical protein
VPVLHKTFVRFKSEMKQNGCPVALFSGSRAKKTDTFFASFFLVPIKVFVLLRSEKKKNPSFRFRKKLLNFAEHFSHFSKNEKKTFFRFKRKIIA